MHSLWRPCTLSSIKIPAQPRKRETRPKNISSSEYNDKINTVSGKMARNAKFSIFNGNWKLKIKWKARETFILYTEQHVNISWLYSMFCTICKTKNTFPDDIQLYFPHNNKSSLPYNQPTSILIFSTFP